MSCILADEPGVGFIASKGRRSSSDKSVVGMTAAAQDMQQLPHPMQSAAMPARPPLTADRAASMPEPAVLEKISIGSAGLDLRRRFGTPQAAHTAGAHPAAAAHLSSSAPPAQLPAYTLPEPARAVSPFAAVASSSLVAAAVARQQPLGAEYGGHTLRSVSLPPIRPALSSHASAEVTCSCTNTTCASEGALS